MPFYVAFEGCDGTGKSTLVANLAALLRARGRQVVETREPGGCPLGLRLRAILKDVELAPSVPALSRRLMFEADRLAQQDMVRGALLAGMAVLTDRTAVVSNHCYGKAEGCSERVVHDLEALDEQRLLPHLVFLVSLPFEACLERLKVGADAQDPVERDRGLLRAVHAEYAKLAEQARRRGSIVTGSGFEVPTYVLDGALPPAALAAKALEVLDVWECGL